MKVNIGCGPTGQINGFDNLDNSPSIFLSKIPFLKIVLYQAGIINEDQYKADWTNVKWCDASRRLPYPSGSVDKIYCSHFLEHIPHRTAIRFLRQCNRVLKEGGVMRIIVPDLLWHAQRYIECSNRIIDQSVLPHDKTAHDAFLDEICGAYLNPKRYGAKHYYMYDLPTLVTTLKLVGFTNIQKYEFQKGFDEELAAYDSRPDESLHIEVRK